MSEQTYIVTGMTCDHCVRSVQEELAKVPGVIAVEVDLPTGRVTVQAGDRLEEGTVAAAVEEAGYELAST